MTDDEVLRASILLKLMRKKKWGGSHTSFDKVKKLVPSHLRGKAKNTIQDLIRENLIITKPTHYGLQISLNQREAKKIYAIVRKYFPEKLFKFGINRVKKR